MIAQQMRQHSFIRLTDLVESWDLNFLKLLYLGSLSQRDVLKNAEDLYLWPHKGSRVNESSYCTNKEICECPKYSKA